MKTASLKAVFLLALVSACGCAELNDPYYNDPYSSGYGYNDYDRRNDYDRHERHKLERERDRLEDERRRLEQARHQPPAYQPPPPSYRPAPVRDSCPPGFSPSERKCTQQERRNGCKDIRTPSGLGCVSR